MKIFKHIFIIIILASTFFLNNIFVFATTTKDNNELDIVSDHVILMEAKTGRVIYSKNPDEKIYPASMTKVLTALITLEYIDPNEIIVIGDEINSIPSDSSKAGNRVGEHITGLNLIRGIIIPSGNESACVAAYNVAKRVSGRKNLKYSEAEKIFTDLMNKKAKELGAVNSHFTNPHGYHNEDLYSTVRDIALISREAIKNKVIAEVAQEISFTGKSAGNFYMGSGLNIEHKWISHNALVNRSKYAYEYATGLKTGFTSHAGSCVSATARKDGVDLIAVIAKSTDTDRWKDARKLFDYAFKNYKLVNIIMKNEVLPEPYNKINLDKPGLGRAETVETRSDREFTYYLTDEEQKNLKMEVTYDTKKTYIEKNKNSKENMEHNKDNTDKKIEYVRYLKTPISENEPIGKIKYSINNNLVFEGNIVVLENTYKANIFRNIIFIFSLIRKYAFTVYGIPFWILGISLSRVFYNVYKYLKKAKKKRHSKYKYVKQNKIKF